MKALKHIFDKYKAWIMAVLAPLGGIWAVFIIALLDSAALGIPMDPIVAYYVHTDPRRTVLYAIMGAAGSALGSLVPYLIGYKGGEELIAKRVGRQKFAKVHSTSEKYGDLALIIPAMMPPGFPFKLFIFAAGVAEMNWIHFLLAVFTGRVARFLLLGALTIRFGPEILGLTQTLFKQHLGLTLGILGGIILLVVVLVRLRRSRADVTVSTTA